MFSDSVELLNEFEESKTEYFKFIKNTHEGSDEEQLSIDFGGIANDTKENSEGKDHFLTQINLNLSRKLRSLS